MKKLDKKTINSILEAVIANGSADREWVIQLLQKAKASGVNKPQEWIYTETDYQMAYHKGFYEGTLATKETIKNCAKSQSCSICLEYLGRNKLNNDTEKWKDLLLQEQKVGEKVE